ILTSTDDQEILDTLEYLKSSSSNTGLIHESFWYKDSNNFTRPWFARKKIRSEEYQQVD
ncbi:2716_t:CDS:2, partial [Entrophospora sp. SA101]